MTQLTSVPDLLKDLGVSETPPLLGWTFSEDVAKDKKEAEEERDKNLKEESKGQRLAAELTVADPPGVGNHEL